MKPYVVFVFLILFIGGVVLGGLFFFPAKTPIILPANIGEAVSPIVETVTSSVSSSLQNATSSPEATTTTHESSTISPIIKTTSTKAISTATVAVPKVPILVATSSAMQGEPVRIVISGTKDPSDIISVDLDHISLPVFLYKNTLQAVYGIDINHKVGDVLITVKLKNKTTISSTLTIYERKKPTHDFTIPESLGGTNPTGEQNVATLLTKENTVLANLSTNPKKLWTQTFAYPVTDPVLTDPYGYNRDTGTQTVTHKGTDFRAPAGTPVYAINRGVVRLVEIFSIYGNTVIIDHGQGIQSFYMHLSKISVSEGTIVSQGQKIGESGETGYAEGPHLHLTIRANGTSIDPMKFFDLYGIPLEN